MEPISFPTMDEPTARVALIGLLETLNPELNQLGECWAYLRAGCSFEVELNSECVDVTIVHPTFGTFDYGADEQETVYSFPTAPPIPREKSEPLSGVKVDYTREELIAICRDAVVPRDKWRNRDTPGAQSQIGHCWQLLRKELPFRVRSDFENKPCRTDARTIWLDIGNEVFYLPTPEWLAESVGRDWY